MIRTKNRILAIIRSNDRLDNVVLNRFIIRHTNEDVYLAYFRINKEVEKVIRAYIDKWLSLYLKGVRLIETV
jgi:lauroyl/myristoyl acyltransferase